jgi:N-acyl amino acid synthase of PEP-CTERM/exosortase system
MNSMTEQTLSPSPEELDSNVFNGQGFYDFYDSLFEGVIANTPDLIDECYKLRYQVYCVEHPFEEPDPGFGEYERDQFDGHAVHALLRARKTGEFIGTVRLIIDDLEGPARIPIKSLSEEHMVSLPASFSKKSYGEISRFCISKKLRRRVTDGMYGSSYTQDELDKINGRVIPYVALGLMRMLFTLARTHNVTQACAVMELSLLRLLAKLGVHFVTLGKPFEFHGTRQIAYLTLEDLHKSLSAERPEILDFITDYNKYPLI